MTILPKKVLDGRIPEEESESDAVAKNSPRRIGHRDVTATVSNSETKSSTTVSNQNQTAVSSESAESCSISSHKARTLEDESIETGYNSADEYDHRITDTNVEEKERMFEKQLKDKRGFVIKKTKPDGACLFRAVADQIYGDQEMHPTVRSLCMDYMLKNSDYYAQYITEDFSTYVQRKRALDCHGNHTEIQALSEMFNRKVEVYSYSVEPINTFQGTSSDDSYPIRLSYHCSIHYNSVLDPLNPSVGVGLGLAGYSPKLDDRPTIQETLLRSQSELEEKMLQDKMMATDWEATDAAISDMVAQQSYLEWYKDRDSSTTRQSPGLKQRSGLNRERSPCELERSKHPRLRDHPPRPRGSSSTRQHDMQAECSVARRNPSSPKAGTSLQSDYELALEFQFLEDFKPDLAFAASMDEDQLLAAVLAESQQEFFLKNVSKSKED